MKRKLLAAVSAAVIAAASLSTPVFAEDAALTSNVNVEMPSETVSGTIHVEKLSTGAKAYVYTPDNALYGMRATATPILVVYGNEAYTSQTAQETAEASGLAAIADLEQGCVIFVNPLGETWSEEDAGSLEAAKNMFSDATVNNAPVSNFTICGKSEDALYPGSYQRLYVFAEGAGADFVYTCLSRGVEGGGQFFGNADFKPHAAFLMNPASTEQVDLAENYDRQVPVVIVNGSEEIKAAYEALNTSVPTMAIESEVTEGFDQTALFTAYDEVIEHYSARVQSSLGLDYCKTSLLPIPGNDELNLTEEKKEYAFEDGTALSYYQWTCGTEGAPLFVIMHGSGSSAENIVWTSCILTLASRDGFNVISLENYRNDDMNNEKLMEAVDSVIEETASDPGRLYIGGFSMGGMTTWGITSEYSDRFAGALAMNGNVRGMGEDGFKGAVPFFAYGGKDSYIASAIEFPTAENYVQEAAIFAANGVDEAFEFDPEYLFGREADNVITIEETLYPDLTVEIHEFASADGTVMTAFGSASSAGHEPVPAAIEAGWKFISQFARDAEGNIVTAE